MSEDNHSRLKDIFLRATRLPGEKREAWLEKACAGDEALRREVESLLDFHQSDTIIARAPGGVKHVEPFVPGKEKARTSPLAPEEGRRISRVLKNPLRRATTFAIALALLVVLSLFVRATIKSSLEGIVAGKLEAVLNADVLALRIWIEERLAEVRRWADEPRVTAEVEALVQAGGNQAGPERRDAFLKLFDSLLSHEEGLRVGLLNTSGRSIVSSEKERPELRIGGTGWKYLSRVMEGETVFVRPYREGDVVNTPREDASDLAFVTTAAPVRNASGDVIASLNFLRPAGGHFTEILGVARMGQSGEAYAFDANGVMLSESRFSDHLYELGLLPGRPEAPSMLNVEIRDPGGNLYQGHAPELEVASRPRTRLAALAIAAGQTGGPGDPRGTILKPYRDYRGVDVIGAWTWLSEHGFGIAVEIDAAEAYEPLLTLDLVFGSLIGLLALATGAYLVASLSVVRLRSEVGSARQLGSYTLLMKIGEGGMGEVYLARHALLKRPTAIKMLKREFATEEFAMRFEREVQLASQLTHPNTIEIYDYGKTADGAVYYAMEYVEGIDLATLVAGDGPLPPARVVHILNQVCASLEEAHRAGIIHRDIKPPNIMLCKRGGECDVAKVLDFGLVKDVANPDSLVTAPARITGTPLYMAPERIRNLENVDARCDIYSIGAVGYFLLTGKDLFTPGSDLEVLFKAANEAPVPVSEAAPGAVPVELGKLIMSCVEKDPADRPRDTTEMRKILDSLAESHRWSQQDAADWWKKWG